ncbi:tubulin polyglutamylase TTLL7 [Selaginella moellendorffii]|uniref:tubulin polyglutamylase TTLL7 n=1 Tax=Selaginella moellendorffii TaxID=88036 RepID=UPI000D1C7043|nr:tubulin polyglutamylase TTLL7 [Selaginella moellendorffii]|eukprot:XP_024523066.1 tubulin polyglutamylase TTLL7 [Selaginella moellendorffii]
MRARSEMPLAIVAPGLNSKRKKKRRKKKKAVCGYIRVDLSCCRYQILRIVLRKLGWEVTTDDSKPWHLIWTGDLELAPSFSLRNSSHARFLLSWKNRLFDRSRQAHDAQARPEDQPFRGNAGDLPQEGAGSQPLHDAQGRGVVLVQTSEEVKNAMKGLHGANFVAQKYLTKPMLLNGYKFDLRIYVLILSCNPLRLYLYREGLARFCTEKYMKPDHKNIKVSRMHLTNYSLNKYSSKFEFNSSTTEVNKGSKWTLTALFKALAAEGFDTNQLYAQIKRMLQDVPQRGRQWTLVF